jgi:L-ribulose-5-phosphate 4-epimerase
MIEALKTKLVTAGRILAQEGQRDYTRGHLSVRHPDNPDLFFMKPQKIGLEEMTAGNIITVNIEGEKVEGDAPRHSEAFIHSEVLRARSDLNAVIHTHPPHAVAFTALGRELQPIGQPSTVFYRGLPVFTETIDLITDRDRGRAVARCLGPHKAMLLRNHGIVVAGATIEEAVYLALLLEDACKLQLLADAAGGAKTLFPPEEVKKLGERLLRAEASETTFAYLARRVDAMDRQA